MPKPIYTFLIKTQLIHAKADLRFTLQNYNKIRNAAIYLENISQIKKKWADFRPFATDESLIC